MRPFNASRLQAVLEFQCLLVSVLLRLEILFAPVPFGQTEVCIKDSHHESWSQRRHETICQNRDPNVLFREQTDQRAKAEYPSGMPHDPRAVIVVDKPAETVGNWCHAFSGKVICLSRQNILRRASFLQ